MTDLGKLVLLYGILIYAGVFMVYLSVFQIESYLRNIEDKIDQLLKDHLEP